MLITETGKTDKIVKNSKDVAWVSQMMKNEQALSILIILVHYIYSSESIIVYI